MIKFLLIGFFILLTGCVVTSVVTWKIVSAKKPRMVQLKLPNQQIINIDKIKGPEQRVQIYVPHSKEFQSNSTGISIVVSYYNNPEGLLAQAKVLSLYPKQFKDYVEFVVVDDGSKEKPARDFKQRFLDILDQPWDVQFIELTEDIGFNSGGAKNTGVMHAKHPRVLLIDMDTWILPNNCYTFLRQNLQPRQFMSNFSVSFNHDPFIGYTHPNVYFIHKSDFLAVGGYDEDFSGNYGIEDEDLRKRLLHHGYSMCNEEQWVSWITDSCIGVTSIKRERQTLLKEASLNWKKLVKNIAAGHPIPTQMARVPYRTI